MCEDCTLGKAKKSSASKKAVVHSKIFGERSFFLKEKSDLKNVMMALIKNSKTKYNIQVQYLHCNNMGENIAFAIACKQEEIGLDFESTTPGTLQQNGHVKWKITMLFNCIHAILHGRKFTTFLRNS